MYTYLHSSSKALDLNTWQLRGFNRRQTLVFLIEIFKNVCSWWIHIGRSSFALLTHFISWLFHTETCKNKPAANKKYWKLVYYISHFTWLRGKNLQTITTASKQASRQTDRPIEHMYVCISMRPLWSSSLSINEHSKWIRLHGEIIFSIQQANILPREQKLYPF